MIDNAIPDGFKEIDDSKNLSQLVRSNAPQYWQYMKDRADRNCQGVICHSKASSPVTPIWAISASFRFGPLPERGR
jgi:predicted CxxxxCH...CXXCH cytochrome family protein